jgi:hypothetical protein
MFGSRKKLTEMGSSIQEKKPATAHVVSHDHVFTFPIGA